MGTQAAAEMPAIPPPVAEPAGAGRCIPLHACALEPQLLKPRPVKGKDAGGCCFLVPAASPDLRAAAPPCLCAAAEPAAAPGGSWFGGWFSGGKKEEAKPAAPVQDLSEDRFAPPPMPNFGAAPEPQFR